MSKNKKIIIIAVITIVVLVSIAGVAYWMWNKSKTTNGSEEKESKVSKIYSQLVEKQAFSFTATSDEENTFYYAKKGEMAYVETTYQGEQTKFVTKEGNYYLVMDDKKTYYKYENNEADLGKIVFQLEELKDEEYTEGKEKIKNKSYQYEEYEGTTEFAIKSIDTEEKTAKTRFYFNGDKLVYIKTIVGDNQEILKIDISDNVDDKLFEIPSDYQEE